VNIHNVLAPNTTPFAIRIIDLNWHRYLHSQEDLIAQQSIQEATCSRILEALNHKLECILLPLRFLQRSNPMVMNYRL